MGRRPSTNLNLPPHMHKRVRGEHTYYYLDTGARPRKEIALGTDYFLALQKYAELAIPQRFTSDVKFGDALQRYLTEIVPTLSANTQHTHRSDAKHVNAFSSTAPIDQIRPMHIRQFLDRHKATPTTANRCKRLFSTIWNHARGWGYTDAQNPCEGIAGFSLPKGTVTSPMPCLQRFIRTPAPRCAMRWTSPT